MVFDSLAVDTARVLPPLVGFAEPVDGVPLAVRPLARLSALTAAHLLRDDQGGFVYDFAALGWPAGWAPEALPPNTRPLTLDGVPFEDLLTGRPRFDVLPLPWLEPPRVQALTRGRPQGVQAAVRSFDQAEPLTEMRYHGGGSNMQSVHVVHAQRRRLTFRGVPGVLNLLGGYGGHTADGEYDGSRLRRGRQLYGRLRYDRPGLSVGLANLHTRHRLGAHGGVIVQGATFNEIYNRTVAQVRLPDAQRQLLRNDLQLTVRARWRPTVDPFTLRAYWTHQRSRYRDGSEGDTTTISRLGVRLRQPLAWRTHRLTADAEVWTDDLRASTAFPATVSTRRTQAHVLLRDSLDQGPTSMVLEVGGHVAEAQVYPSARVEVERAGPVQLRGTLSTGGRGSTWVEANGYGAHVVGASSTPRPRVQRARVEATIVRGAWTLSAFAYAHRHTDWTDLVATDVADSLVVRTLNEAVTWAGVGAEVYWRREATRGLYGTLRPVTHSLVAASDTPEQVALAASLPEGYVSARLGVRQLLFQGDLDLDAYLQGRAWTRFGSRTLHPQTGLLVLPEATTVEAPGSAALDFIAQGDVRTATLFIAFENLLSGPLVSGAPAPFAGNFMVPLYPLPERRFRFGVFWPILN